MLFFGSVDDQGLSGIQRQLRQARLFVCRLLPLYSCQLVTGLLVVDLLLC